MLDQRFLRWRVYMLRLSQQTRGIESMLAQSRRQCANIKPILAQCRVFAQMQRSR